MKIFMIYLFFIGFDIFVVFVVVDANADADDFIVDSSKTGIYDT